MILNNKNIYNVDLFLELTLNILRHAKRFHITVSFIADTGLKEFMDKGTLIYSIM